VRMHASVQAAVRAYLPPADFEQAVLAAAEALRDIMPKRRRGLRVGLFNVEEWWLIGSRHHLDTLDPRERAKLAFNVNLDSVAGTSPISIMTSGIQAADALLDQVNREHGFGLRRHRPYMSNSDHANFIEAGIPALRLFAGLDQPESNMRYLLTAGDTPDKVDPTELKTAATITAAFVLAAAERDFVPLTASEIATITAAI
jgi:aminopeptidase YwaD